MTEITTTRLLRAHTKSLRLAFSIFLTFYLLVFSAFVKAEGRHALVIGNSEYGSGFSLINPLNDSNAIAAKLSSIGYEVHTGRALHDLQIDEFNDEIDSFLRNLEDGASTLIYYAGHGSASAGSNFLIPILPEGVRLRTESDIRNRSISLESIFERIQQHNPSGVNVMLFDACRDAPVDLGTRSINLTGLTSLDARFQPQGSFIGFSTEYGKVAVDGIDSNFSPFAEAILNNLDTRADAPIELFYKSVSNEVYQATSGQQFPIQEPKIRGDFCLVDCESLTTAGTGVGAGAQSPVQEFGTLSVLAKPLDAEVCYQVENEWEFWNCGQQMTLPLGKRINIQVSADNHKTHNTSTTLKTAQQQLAISLKPVASRGYKIAGAIAAVVVTGLLLSGKSGSSSGSNSDTADGYSITLTRP